MAITSGFFDSVDGDRTYDADQMSNYFDGLISNGVYETVGERFNVTTANNGMSIDVGSGRAIIQSHWIKNDATTTLTLDPSDVQLNRVDAIVLRLDTSARSIELAVKKGTAVSGTPTIPAITRTQTVYELYIAAVYVKKGATQPTSITDLRPSSYCGWVTGVVQQVNTADLFNQWYIAYAQQFKVFDSFMQTKMEEFEEWFTALTQQLTVEAGFVKYQNQVHIPPHDVAHVAMVIPVGIEDYDPDSDALLVFFEGVFWAENTEYEITTWEGKPAIMMTHSVLNPSTKRRSFTFIVFKNIIGKNVLQPNVSYIETSFADEAPIIAPPESIESPEPVES